MWICVKIPEICTINSIGRFRGVWKGHSHMRDIQVKDRVALISSRGPLSPAGGFIDQVLERENRRKGYSSLRRSHTAVFTSYSFSSSLLRGCKRNLSNHPSDKHRQYGPHIRAHRILIDVNFCKRHIRAVEPLVRG